MRQLELFKTALLEEPAPEPKLEPRRRAAPAAPGGTADLERRLGQLLESGLRSLTLTNNRSRIVSARRAAGGLAVRINRSFTHASPATLAKVAEFLEGARGARRQRALAAIREHFEQHREKAAARKARRRARIEPVGRHFNLEEIRDDLNRRYFGSRLEVEITWGRKARRVPRARRRRSRCFSLRLGSYHDREDLIRVHRALDRRDVPRYVVESVVYHELLHAAVAPIESPGRRRQIHPPEFRRREREFPHYQAAEAWLAKNLGRLAGVD